MTEIPTKVRLDKWLWAARFYKTRSLAAEAIDGGKVQVNGDRAKRSKMVEIGDQIRVRNGPYEYQIHVRELSERRGSASIAATLYEETEASKKAREVTAALVENFGGKVDQGLVDAAVDQRLKGALQ